MPRTDARDDPLFSVIASSIFLMGVLLGIPFVIAGLLLHSQKIVRSRSSSIQEPQVKRKGYVKITNLEKKHDDALVRQSNSSKLSEIICYEDEVEANGTVNVKEHCVNGEEPQDLSKVVQKYLDRKVQREAQPELPAKPKLDSRDSWLAEVPRMLTQKVLEDTTVKSTSYGDSILPGSVPLKQEPMEILASNENTGFNSSKFVQPAPEVKAWSGVVEVVSLEDIGEDEILNI